MAVAHMKEIDSLLDVLADSTVPCEDARRQMVSAAAAVESLAVAVERGNRLGLPPFAERPFDPAAAGPASTGSSGSVSAEPRDFKGYGDRVRQTLARIDALNPDVRAIIERCDETACQLARRLDEEASGGAGPVRALGGMTFTVKDVFGLAGHPPRANSRLLRNGGIAEKSAKLVSEMTGAGAVPVGKTVCWELSIAETDDSEALFPRARNPWNMSRDTGGSSSGSAAAVAAGLCDISLCTDTGGSTRGPASWCGLVGYKASKGHFSMEGCLPLSPDFDSIGLMARQVEPCTRAFDALTGPAPERLKTAARGPRRIGIWRDAYRKDAPATEDVIRAFEGALAAQHSDAVEFCEIDLPPLEYFSAAYVILARAQTYRAWRSALQADPDSLGQTARNRILSCGLFGPDLVDQAQALRTKLRHHVDAAFRAVDVIAMPTMPIAAPDCCDAALVMAFDKPSYVRFASLFGLPSISLPCGLTPEGMPVGAMLTAAYGQDCDLLEIAGTCETALPTLTPPLFEGK